MRSVLVLAVLLAGCSSDPCAGVKGTCIAVAEGASETEVQTALLNVTDGGTVAFAAGTFSFKTDLSLDVAGVTIQGAGADATILSFAHQVTGGQGVTVTGDRFAIHDLAIEDPPGDGLKILGAHGVTIQKVRVEWTHGAKDTNGAYGLYPVQCSDVLIEDSVVKGASDSGIYVGQSDRVIVRRNRAELNVAGIEIENSSHADVHDNVATHNTGGILVFNLPGLVVKNGAGTRVYANQIIDNNTQNFAPSGNIVGQVPAGTGVAMLAAHDVEVFGNTISNHQAINVGIISYLPIGETTDATYDKYPTAISIHDNEMSGTSDNPTGPLGALLISALGEIQASGPYIVPDIAWDGALDPARVVGDRYPADLEICAHANGDADFIDLAWPLFDAAKPTKGFGRHDCMHAALPGLDP